MNWFVDEKIKEYIVVVIKRKTFFLPYIHDFKSLFEIVLQKKIMIIFLNGKTPTILIFTHSV